jgi:XTP/dITP diphosphohydrolase
VTSPKPGILIATRNAGKLAEFERMLGAEFEITGLDGLDLILPHEGVESYRTNAEQKARFVAEYTGRLTLGDDSGIEASALDGRPGIISARFAGEPVSDQRNREKLLSELETSGSNDRSAQFVCWLSLADANGVIVSVEGRCEGTVGLKEKGFNGFGYDPLFVFADGRTMAELTNGEKDAVSHRGNAIRAILPYLRHRVVDGDDNA